MRRFGLIQIGLVLVGGAMAGWEVLRASHWRFELASVTAQIEAQKQKLASRRQALDASERRNRELQEAERRAGNQTLLSLMRERNEFSMAAAQATAEAARKSHPFAVALATTIESPEHRRANEDSRRAEMRVGLYQFLKLLNLPADKSEAYIELNVQKEQRQADRLSELLQGKITLDEATRESAKDNVEHEQRCQEVLGDEGMKLLNGIADGMRNDEAKRLLGIIQDNMGSNRLNQNQSDRLQSLLKTEILTINTDDVELFRPPEDWTQDILARQQRIVSEATVFLNPDQLETLKTLGAADLAERQKQMANRRTALGIK
jgi:hypothetical protein